VFEQLVARFRLRIEQKMIFKTEQIHVAQNAALGIEEKGVAAIAGL